MPAVNWADVRWLWVGLLGGPVAWAVQLEAVYALTSWACGHVSVVVGLHLIAAACLLSAAGAGWVAWRTGEAAGGWPASADEPAVGRARLLAGLGVMTGTLFSVVILAQWLAVMTLNSCEH